MASDTTKPVNRSGAKSPPLLGFRAPSRGRERQFAQGAVAEETNLKSNVLCFLQTYCALS